jgi:hypothetical protein
MALMELKPGVRTRVHIGADGRFRLPFDWVADFVKAEYDPGDPDDLDAVFCGWRETIERFVPSECPRGPQTPRPLIVHQVGDNKGLLCYGCLAAVGIEYAHRGVSIICPGFIKTGFDFLELATILSRLDAGWCLTLAHTGVDARPIPSAKDG